MTQPRNQSERLNAIGDSNLRQDGTHVLFYCVFTDRQLGCNSFVSPATYCQHQDIGLSIAEGERIFKMILHSRIFLSLIWKVTFELHQSLNCVEKISMTRLFPNESVGSSFSRTGKYTWVIICANNKYAQIRVLCCQLSNK